MSESAMHRPLSSGEGAFRSPRPHAPYLSPRRPRNAVPAKADVARGNADALVFSGVNAVIVPRVHGTPQRGGLVLLAGTCGTAAASAIGPVSGDKKDYTD
jgi:hypothetical protein